MEYRINENLSISNININQDEIFYDIDFNEENITEEEAIKLSEEFVINSVKNFIKKNNEWVKIYKEN